MQPAPAISWIDVHQCFHTQANLSRKQQGAGSLCVYKIPGKLIIHPGSNLGESYTYPTVKQILPISCFFQAETTPYLRPFGQKMSYQRGQSHLIFKEGVRGEKGVGVKNQN